MVTSRQKENADSGYYVLTEWDYSGHIGANNTWWARSSIRLLNSLLVLAVAAS